MRRELKLVHGLGTHMEAPERTVMYALAFDAKCGGVGMASDRRLRNATGLSSRTLRHFLRKLEIEGWITRDGECFTLSISKLEAHQKIVVSAARIAALGDNPISVD